MSYECDQCEYVTDQKSNYKKYTMMSGNIIVSCAKQLTKISEPTHSKVVSSVITVSILEMTETKENHSEIATTIIFPFIRYG